MFTIGAIAVIKMVGIAASSYGSWEAWRSMPGGKEKRRLTQLFRDGDLSLQLRRSYKGKPDHVTRKYPRIKEVRFYDDKMTIVFVIPDGLDPAIVWKKEYLLRQGFGNYVELTEKHSKVFIADVYDHDIKPLIYDIDEIAAAVKGLEVPILVGRGRTGLIAYDAVTHPHLLIAGETGSGKSVALRSVLSTLVLTAGDRVRLYCIDLKRSEFHLFRGVAEKVDTDAVSATQTLHLISREMKNRGRLLEDFEVEHINELPKDKRPPYIVLAIDEFSLLKDDKYAMAAITHIGNIGRAYGVLMVLATQRPDADIIEGKMKVNLSARMAFRLPDEVNSRIAIGTGAAATISREQKGRMAFSLLGIQYVQSPYLTMPKAKELLAPRKAVKVGTGSARKAAPDAPVIETEELTEGLWGAVDDEGEG